METILLEGVGTETMIEQDLPRERVVDASAFCALLLSHRRMVRFDRADHRVRGLRDLDTGEVFLTDARRLVETRR
jgi:hypothetical protein